MFEGIIAAFGGPENEIPPDWKPCDGRQLWSGAFPVASQKIGGISGPADPNGFLHSPTLLGTSFVE